MQRRFLRWLAAGALSLTAASACSSKPSEEACSVTAPSECPSPAVTFKDVEPIFTTTCASCHTGIGEAPWALKDYQDVADWQELVRADILDCSMPPPDSGVHISNEERLRILNWVRCGALP